MGELNDTFKNNSADGPLAKRPVAWRVKDYADGWIVFQDEEIATKMADEMGAAIQGLYVRDGTSKGETQAEFEARQIAADPNWKDRHPQ